MRGGGTSCSFTTRSQSLVSLSLWTVNFTRISKIFFSSPWVGQDNWNGLELIIFLPSGHLDSDNTQQIRLLLTSFSWGQALKRRGCPGVFQNWSFFLSPCYNQGRFYFSIYCGNLIELLKVHVTILWGQLWLVPSEVFNFQSCPHWASSKLSTTVEVFLLWHCFLQWFSRVSWCSHKAQICLPLQSQGQWFDSCSYLSYESVKSCLVFSLFSSLPYIGSWKREVHKLTLNNRTIILEKIYGTPTSWRGA